MSLQQRLLYAVCLVMGGTIEDSTGMDVFERFADDKVDAFF